MKRNLSSSNPNLLGPTAVSSNLHGTYRQQHPHLRPDSNPTSNIHSPPGTHQTNIPNSLNVNNHSSTRQPRIVAPLSTRSTTHTSNLTGMTGSYIPSHAFHPLLFSPLQSNLNAALIVTTSSNPPNLFQTLCKACSRSHSNLSGSSHPVHLLLTHHFTQPISPEPSLSISYPHPSQKGRSDKNHFSHSRVV